MELNSHAIARVESEMQREKSLCRNGGALAFLSSRPAAMLARCGSLVELCYQAIGQRLAVDRYSGGARVWSTAYPQRPVSVAAITKPNTAQPIGRPAYLAVRNAIAPSPKTRNTIQNRMPALLSIVATRPYLRAFVMAAQGVVQVDSRAGAGAVGEEDEGSGC